ncbi:hypothetical protein GCM10009624_07300 [Gordonia sinesedis]
MNAAPDFTPTTSGTPEAAWLAELNRRAPLPNIDLDGVALVVVAAHPDDETLGCAGLIQHALRRGSPVTVVLATWGEGSHPDSPTTPPGVLAERRRHEVRTALSLLDDAPVSGRRVASTELVAVGLTDGDVGAGHDALTAAIVQAVAARGYRRSVVVAPWRHDGHPDHEAAGRAAAAAAARTDSALLEYPIWFWHWGTTASLPTSGIVAHHLGDRDRAVKRAAIRAHTSQVQPLSADPADAAILPAHVLDHFHRELEIFLVDPAPTDHRAFDRLHRENPDPWDTDSAYERAKRRATLAMLDGFAAPERALEIGCSVGALTNDLAEVCTQVVGLEASPAAADHAMRRTAARPGVRIVTGAVPDEFPDGTYDLIVLSEVGYFLSPADLHRTISSATRHLTAGGLLLACHWTHPVDGWLLDGPTVHATLCGVLGSPIRSDPHPDYALDLWRCR